MLSCTADMDLATQDLALRTSDYLLGGGGADNQDQVGGKHGPRDDIAAGPVSCIRTSAAGPWATGACRMGMSRLPLRMAFFTSPMALGDADLARARLGAVEDRAPAPHALAAVQNLQPLVRRLVARVEDDAVRVHDRRGAHEVFVRGHSKDVLETLADKHQPWPVILSLRGASGDPKPPGEWPKGHPSHRLADVCAGWETASLAAHCRPVDLVVKAAVVATDMGAAPGDPDQTLYKG